MYNILLTELLWTLKPKNQLMRVNSINNHVVIRWSHSQFESAPCVQVIFSGYHTASTFIASHRSMLIKRLNSVCSATRRIVEYCRTNTKYHKSIICLKFRKLQNCELIFLFLLLISYRRKVSHIYIIKYFNC